MSKPVNVDKFKGSWEPQVYKELRAIQPQADFTIAYESVKLPYRIEHVYVPDFVITLKSGKVIFVEAKGYWDAQDRRKLVAVKAQNPEADIRMVFQANSKVHKASETRYADWCTKHDFVYSVKVIPKDWFQE